MGLKKIHTDFEPENLKERGNLRDKVMDETILIDLKEILCYDGGCLSLYAE
jgi:hypothetical protein